MLKYFLINTIILPKKKKQKKKTHTHKFNQKRKKKWFIKFFINVLWQRSATIEQFLFAFVQAIFKFKHFCFLLWTFSKLFGLSNHYALLGNALQKHSFVYSALIMDTLKGSIHRFFNFKSKFLRGFDWTRFVLTFPYGQKSMSKKTDTHLILKKI